MSSPEAAAEPPEPLAGWRWWTGLAAGGAVGLFGLAGLLRDATKTKPLVWLAWLVGLLLVHDFVLAPLVLLVGRWLRDRVPEAWRWPLQVGLVTSGVLVLASVPVLYGVGRRTQPGNASVLPGHYPLALAVVLVVVWLGVLALGIWSSTGGRRRSPSPACASWSRRSDRTPTRRPPDHGDRPYHRAPRLSAARRRWRASRTRRG